MAVVSSRSTPDLWREEDWVKNFLAEQLTRRRLSLVIGAGVSVGLGLPTWTALVDHLFEKAKLSPVHGQSIEVAAEDVLTRGFANDRIKFAEAIREAMYARVNANPKLVETSELMSALGALVMSSARGSVSNVVTFNFDTLLEEHLESRGYVVRSVDALPAWADGGDVTVLHPHGALPRDLSVPVRRGVVFTQHDFAAIIGQEQDLWRQRVSDILRSSTCLFLGLSGSDMNLVSMIQSAAPGHCSRPDAFWGVRFGGPNDTMGAVWEKRGVLNVTLPAHEALAGWLMDVCRRAAKMRRIAAT